MIEIDVGENIREARKGADLTQKELSEEIGVHWNTVARWERNEIECRIDQLGKIAEVTGKPLAWFVGGNASAGSGKFFVDIHGIKFKFAREKNGYSRAEMAMLLELPEEQVAALEEQNASVEMEYIHRMVFILGYPGSWFFTSEYNKIWCDGGEIEVRWLETGKEKWKFKDLFYSAWELKRMRPMLDLDDFMNWKGKLIPEKSKMTEAQKADFEKLKSLTGSLSESVISEVEYFLERRREEERLTAGRSSFKESIGVIASMMEANSKKSS